MKIKVVSRPWRWSSGCGRRIEADGFEQGSHLGSDGETAIYRGVLNGQPGKIRVPKSAIRADRVETDAEFVSDE